MATIQEALAAAIAHHQAGRLPEAEQIYRQILQVDPGHAESWHLLGMIAYQAGQRDVAVEYVQRALALRPDYPEAQTNLGNFLKDAGRLDEAIGCFKRAVQLSPTTAEYHFNLANALQQRGQSTDAIESYRRAIELKPGLVQAQFQLGVSLQGVGRTDEAAACYRQFLTMRPDVAEAHNNLGVILLNRGRFHEADFHFGQAVALSPGYVAAWNNRGNLLRSQERLDEARDCYVRALQLQPGDATAGTNLGNIFLTLGRLDEAIKLYQEVLKRNPAFSEAHCNLGNALKNGGQIEEAIGCYRKALEFDPGFVEAQSNLLYALYYCPAYEAKTIYEEHRRWNEQHARPLAKFIAPYRNAADSNRRLRVGYISPNFRRQAEVFFIVPLMAARDRQQVEVFYYSDVYPPDQMTAQLQADADAWREIVGLTDAQVAQLVREDQIDVLVDLSLHMSGNRILVFARKPAPVQVCWLAYQGTTGLETMDYRLTDAHVDPPRMFDDCYSEESIRLPDAFGCYDPLTTEPAVNRLPAVAKGYVTFGSLNTFTKINRGVLKLWGAVLAAVAGSRLFLLAPEGSQRQRALDILQQEGASPERVSFFTQRPRGLYLELYHQIDIGLDTLPYNGQTTTLDALWMGVPVVSMVGQTAVGRAGLSLLTNLGMPELVANSPEQFVQIAAELARDLERLSGLRSSLRERLERSPLMDGPRFARSVEAAYREMWRRWCKSQASGR